jgi:stage IV sporulation protein B
LCKEEGKVTRKEKLRKSLIVLFWAGLVVLAGSSYFYMQWSIPDRLNVVVDQEENFHFSLPVKVSLKSESEEVVLNNGSNIPSDEIHLQLDQPFSLYSENEGTYHLNMKLFGLFSLKDIEVDVSDTKYAVPCGLPIGIYMKSDGLMVIGTGEVTTKNGDIIDPADGVLKSGDYIEAINGVPAVNKKDMIQAVNSSGGGALTLSVRRDGEEMPVEMTPVETADGDFKLGLWIRDDTQGIGTMTYISTNGEFGALGHGISDSDTGMLVQTSGGELYDTEIMGIEKGTFGKPGVMSGVIYYGNQSKLGAIEANTNEGIFGTVNEKFRNRVKSEAIPIGYRQDVKKGKHMLEATYREN